MATSKKDSSKNSDERRPPKCDVIIAEINKTLQEVCKSKQNYLDVCKLENPLPQPPKPCQPVKFPSILPQVSIKWGDSECDCFETNDTEVLCVTVCNPYSNVTLKDLKIASIRVCDENGKDVLPLPDGTPSVQLIPRGPYCFGDIAPCEGEQQHCVSREFVIQTCGAKPGKYRIKLEGICFDVWYHYDSSYCFELKLCKD